MKALNKEISKIIEETHETCDHIKRIQYDSKIQKLAKIFYKN